MKEETIVPLTNEQNKLITDNITQIKGLIFKILNNTQNKVFGQKSTVLTDEALSYLAEVSIEFDPEKVKTQTFIQFAAPRCILRLIDEYRRTHRHIRVNVAKRAVLEQVLLHFLKNGIDSTPENIDNRLKELGLDPKRFEKTNKPKQIPMRTVEKNFTVREKSFDEFEWQDLEEAILKRAETYFIEMNEPGLETINHSRKIRKTLIRDYIIPECKGLKTKNLSDLSKELGVTEGRLSQMSSDEPMKNFFKIFFD